MAQTPIARRATTVAVAAYVGIILAATLYPFRLRVPLYFREAQTPAPVWDPADGMVFDGIGLFWTGSPSPTVADALMDAGRWYVYLEAWPARRTQYGPSRLFALSRGRDYQAFMVGQHGSDLAVRVRGADPTRPAGRVTSLRVRHGLAARTWNRVLIVVSPEAVRIYCNGELRQVFPGVRIEPSTWRRDCYLLAGNEATGDRGWRGRLRRVALGSGPPPARILREAGVAAQPEADTPGQADALLFELSASAGQRPAWTSQKENVWGKGLPPPWTLIPFRHVTQIRRPWIDWVLNVGLFVPLGWLWRRRGMGLTRVAVCACGLSLAVETAQVFLAMRTSDATDVLLNTAGAVLGALIASAMSRATSAAADAPAPHSTP